MCASGTKLVEYQYDAWSKVTVASGSNANLAAKNPFRYRGYYYDSETGFYYLQSRYYDPQTGRFLNADAYADTGDTVLSTNMFAYCENNPVNGVDPSGEASMPWKYLPYPGYIHMVVQDYLSSMFGLRKEYLTKNKKGRIDLFRTRTREAWEVKPMSVPISVARLQLRMYKSQMGGDLKFGRLLGKHIFQFGIFKIYVYANQAIGVVRYSFDLNKLGKRLAAMFSASYLVAVARYERMVSSISEARKRLYNPDTYIDYDNPDCGEHFWPFY